MFNDTASQPATIAVGTAASQVLEKRQWRESLTIQNTATATVYIGYGPGVTATNGFRVRPDEVFFEDKYIGPVFAIATAAVDIPYIEVGV